MMAELVKYVSQLEKELIKNGANVDEIKESIGKKYEVDKIRNDPNHKGQDLVYYYGALRQEYLRILNKDNRI